MTLNQFRCNNMMLMFYALRFNGIISLNNTLLKKSKELSMTKKQYVTNQELPLSSNISRKKRRKTFKKNK